VILTLESVAQILSVTIQMKATEQYFPVLLFVTLYKVVLTFESVDDILKNFPVVLFIMLYKVVLKFESVDEILKFDHSSESTCPFLWCCLWCKVF